MNDFRIDLKKPALEVLDGQLGFRKTGIEYSAIPEAIALSETTNDRNVLKMCALVVATKAADWSTEAADKFLSIVDKISGISAEDAIQTIFRALNKEDLQHQLTLKHEGVAKRLLSLVSQVEASGNIHGALALYSYIAFDHVIAKGMPTSPELIASLDRCMTALFPTDPKTVQTLVRRFFHYIDDAEQTNVVIGCPDYREEVDSPLKGMVRKFMTTASTVQAVSDTKLLPK